MLVEGCQLPVENSWGVIGVRLDSKLNSQQYLNNVCIQWNNDLNSYKKLNIKLLPLEENMQIQDS